jgi:hypothetical protein
MSTVATVSDCQARRGPNGDMQCRACGLNWDPQDDKPDACRAELAKLPRIKAPPLAAKLVPVMPRLGFASGARKW